MRLVCPNCGAQYEVPDDVIPQGGRDVQCSNCGHTWFQVHPEQDAGLAEDLEEPSAPDDFDAGEPDAPAGDETTWDATGDDLPLADDLRPEENDIWDEEEEDETSIRSWDTPAAAPETEAGLSPSEEYEDDYESWEDTPEPASEPRRNLDPGVADLLREEAEREARQRAAERGGLETQPELGLTQSDDDEASRRQREAQERMARLRGEQVPDTDPQSDADDAAMRAAAASAAASRRDLLPDIDEINSTLRSTSDRRPAATAGDHDTPGPVRAAPAAPKRAGGFRRGFSFVVLLMVLALALYIFAPRLAEMVPALRDPLAAYVDAMNGLRLWIDEQLRAVLGWLDSMSSEQG